MGSGSSYPVEIPTSEVDAKAAGYTDQQIKRYLQDHPASSIEAALAAGHSPSELDDYIHASASPTPSTFPALSLSSPSQNSMVKAFLRSVFECLHCVSDLAAIRVVCREWHASKLDAAWRRHVCEMCPFPEVWHIFANQPSKGDFFEAYYRLRRAHASLNRQWTPEFRDSFRYGKYSRWVCGYSSPDFVWPLLFSVRMFWLAAPKSLLDIPALLDDGLHYDPSYSTCAQGWWSDLSERVEFPSVGRSAFLALMILEKGRSTECKKHLSSWWGDDRRSELLPQLFDLGHFVALAEFISGTHDLSIEEGARSAQRPEKPTTISAWHLHANSDALDSLFWDVNGITCRGITHCAKESMADIFPEGFRNRFSSVDTIHYRQKPHLLNLVLLGRHVSELYSKEVS